MKKNLIYHRDYETLQRYRYQEFEIVPSLSGPYEHITSPKLISSSLNNVLELECINTFNRFVRRSDKRDTDADFELQASRLLDFPSKYSKYISTSLVLVRSMEFVFDL